MGLALNVITIIVIALGREGLGRSLSTATRSSAKHRWRDLSDAAIKIRYRKASPDEKRRIAETHPSLKGRYNHVFVAIAIEKGGPKHVVGRMLSKISRKEELKEEEKLVLDKISAPPEGVRLCLKKEAQQGCYSVKQRPRQLGYLKWISVDEDWREGGLGTNLLRKGIQSITESWPHVAALWLKVERENGAARRLYRRLDFERVGESKGFYIYARYFTPSKPDTPSPPTQPRPE
ncbi:hypothetical protein FOZ61_002020 [Perkinsus olseni]|uniref:N-acetyltransferase domain-containing protein n=1 Tax=Perkinsus olseni TaxID=32597 RepID=A0A7J6LUM5_PEROL|nr:hypothetical protein FOZ61_002020 [Perkinsus olseni]KAF4667887.1 hypothetical protein FOL46_002301 [Perkinsus olseni]